MSPKNPAGGAGKSKPQSPPPGSHRFSLRQLETFAEIATLGSISAAAERLLRTQSAVSMSLAELESALGVTLFERRGRRLIRTEAAERLLPRAIEMVDRAREIHRLVDPAQERPAQLAVGASRTIGPYVMPGLIHACTEKLPELRTTITVANSEDLLGQILGFALDIAFIEGDVLDPTLHRQAWLADQLCLYARHDHPIFESPGRITRRLTAWPWVLRERGSGTREIFLRAAARYLDSAPRIVLEVNDAETQKRLLQTSDWLACMSRRVLSANPMDEGLREIQVPRVFGDALTRRFWIVRHPERFHTQAMATILETAQSYG